MNDFPAKFNSPEDAYFGFFEADRSKDGAAWAAVMSYPHVRVAAAGSTEFFQTAKEYADAADWTQREATGWVRTAGDDPVILHETQRKVHLLGGWTRYNADDEPILWNRVTYILTRPEDSWGVQARFALGSYDRNHEEESARSEATVAALDLVERFTYALGRGDDAAIAEICRLPLVEVDIGDVSRSQGISEKAIRDYSAVSDAGVVQTGARGCIVSVSGSTGHGILLVGRQADSWQIAGISHIKEKSA